MDLVMSILLGVVIGYIGAIIGYLISQREHTIDTQRMNFSYVDYNLKPHYGYEFIMNDGSKVLVDWTMIVLPKEGKLRLVADPIGTKERGQP